MAKGLKTGGRQAGTPNRTSSDLRDLAKAYTADALGELHRIMTASPSDQARVAAAKELLDRGHGKPTQAVDVEAKMLGAVTVTYVTTSAAPGVPAGSAEDYET